MADTSPDLARRNVPVLAGQSILSQVAWTLGSPSVVLPFLAVSLELPMFLAGALVSIRMFGSMVADVFLAHSIAARERKKRAIALTEVAVGACLVLALALAATGVVPIVALAFATAFLMIGLIEEVQSLLYTDLIGDHVKSKSRMALHYLQLGAGGLATIGLALLIHQIMKDAPPFSRHSAVIAVSVTFFVLSGLSILAMAEAEKKKETSEKDVGKTRFVENFTNISKMFEQPWFRHYMVMRLPLVVVSLSVPFFALIAAEAHHSSAKGLTAMIVSSASGYLVSAPLWQVVNMKSHRAVMVAGTLMVACTGIALLSVHYLGADHDIHLHAAALFVVTVAVTGVSSARKLYFLDVAPKDQRVQGAAAIKSICRISAVVISSVLAAVAHMHEVSLAIMFICAVSILAAVLCYRVVIPEEVKAANL
ncbi:permease [Ruegeria arenilitoris]|uniref:permease n=1 Tax=Ruegeria arenilitoris TaxID=1173585 RepID=UPI001480A76E|nr:permease [Ruegeria arenilitoris]